MITINPIFIPPTIVTLFTLYLFNIEHHLFDYYVWASTFLSLDSISTYIDEQNENS